MVRLHPELSDIGANKDSFCRAPIHRNLSVY